MFYLKKLMVHTGILMETIGISVMVSIVILAGSTVIKTKQRKSTQIQIP